MKTLKKIAAVSIALILFGTTAVLAGNGKPSASKSPGSPGIRYQVNIHPAGDIPLGDAYIVQLKDQNGRVAWQVYQPGVNVYNFYERGPVWGAKIARMVPNPYLDRKAGLPNLFCPADVMTGPFENGRSYTFDLYPSYTPPDKE